MDWDFKYLPELRIVSVTTSGDLDYDAMEEFIAAAAAAMKKHDVDGILVDHRDAVLRLSRTRAYRIPAVEVAHGIERRHKVAVVLAPSTAHEDDVRFYLEAMQRNGLPHRLFRDPDAALDWLLERKADGP